MRDKLNQFVEQLKNLGARNLAIIGGVIALTLVGLGALALTTSTNASKELLYSGLPQQKAGNVVGQLDQMGVNYTLKGGGTTIMVPQGEAARIRMRLAQQGVPSRTPKGYAILDQQDPMGMTDARLRVSHVRAREGEIEMSIATMNNVESARVQIVMPDRSPFAREAPEPRASVKITSAAAGGIGEQKAAAIRSLVMGAVPKLKASNISVVDSNGIVIAADDGSGNVGAASDMAELRQQREADIRNAIREVLAPYVGRENVRATVTAEINRSSATVKERNYDPEERVLRSVQSVEETESSEEQEPENASAGQNTPAGGANGNNGQATSTSEAERREETRNFEISNMQRTERQPAGALEAVNVAVVVDGTYETGNQGDPTFVPRSDEQMEKIRNLVQSAVGFSEQRGDQLAIRQAQFSRPAQQMADADTESADTDQSALGVWDYLAIALVAVVVLLFGLFMWRALANRREAGQEDQQPLIEGGQAAGPQGALPAGEQNQESVEFHGDTYTIDPDVMQSIVKNIEDHPEETAFAIQQMLASDDTSTTDRKT